MSSDSLVVADAANLVADFRVEGALFEGHLSQREATSK